MLTDDDLTRDLSAAFRGATSDLDYDRATPRVPRHRSALLTVPAAAGVVAVLGIGAAMHGNPAQAPDEQQTAPRATINHRVFDEHLSLAGFTSKVSTMVRPWPGIRRNGSCRTGTLAGAARGGAPYPVNGWRRKADDLSAVCDCGPAAGAGTGVRRTGSSPPLRASAPAVPAAPRATAPASNARRRVSN